MLYYTMLCYAIIIMTMTFDAYENQCISETIRGHIRKVDAIKRLIVTTSKQNMDYCQFADSLPEIGSTFHFEILHC